MTPEARKAGASLLCRIAVNLADGSEPSAFDAAAWEEWIEGIDQLPDFWFLLTTTLARAISEFLGESKPRWVGKISAWRDRFLAGKPMALSDVVLSARVMAWQEENCG